MDIVDARATGAGIALRAHMLRCGMLAAIVLLIARALTADVAVVK